MMSTVIRPDISKKKPYWIDRHRYYELKHFCLQYPLFKKMYSSLDGYSSGSAIRTLNTRSASDPTQHIAEKRVSFLNRIDMIESAAKQTDAMLSDYILAAVTQELSYEQLKARFDIPCCRDTYYNAYRRFFWILSEKRQ